MWDLPRPGFEPMSPSLAGRFLTTGPPETPSCSFLNHTLSVHKPPEENTMIVSLNPEVPTLWKGSLSCQFCYWKSQQDSNEMPLFQPAEGAQGGSKPSWSWLLVILAFVLLAFLIHFWEWQHLRAASQVFKWWQMGVFPHKQALHTSISRKSGLFPLKFKLHPLILKLWRKKITGENNSVLSMWQFSINTASLSIFLIWNCQKPRSALCMSKQLNSR